MTIKKPIEELMEKYPNPLADNVVDYLQINGSDIITNSNGSYRVICNNKVIAQTGCLEAAKNMLIDALNQKNS